MAGRPERPGAQEWVPPEGDVDALRGAAPGCRGCELWADATQVVFSTGPDDARLVLVGEQPGDKEDRTGEPFVGPAGDLLAEALEAAGIDPARVYLTNAVKHFRFVERGKRRIHKTPGTVHVRACHPWLEAELTAVAPSTVVALGATAARAVLGKEVRIGEVRGKVLDVDAAEGPGGARAEGDEHRTFRVVVTTHPSAVLRRRGRPGFEDDMGALVADLRTAAAA